MSHTTSFTMDDKAIAIVNHLKKEMGLQSNIELFRKALQLLNVVMSSKDKSATLKFSEGYIRVFVG